MLQEENLFTHVSVTVGDGCWFDVCGWPGRVGAGYCKSVCRHIWQRYSRKCTHCVYTHRPILFDITDALEDLALYACVGGHHMLHKFCNYFSISFIKQLPCCKWFMGSVGVCGCTYTRCPTSFLAWDIGSHLSVMPAPHCGLQDLLMMVNTHLHINWVALPTHPYKDMFDIMRWKQRNHSLIPGNCWLSISCIYTSKHLCFQPKQEHRLFHTMLTLY